MRGSPDLNFGTGESTLPIEGHSNLSAIIFLYVYFINALKNQDR